MSRQWFSAGCVFWKPAAFEKTLEGRPNPSVDGGRHWGLGSALRKASRVTGATSPGLFSVGFRFLRLFQ